MSENETKQPSQPEIRLEERFQRIESVLDHMEDPEVTLEESFTLYRKGLEELSAANAMLDEMEQAMLVMTEDGELEEF